MSLKFLMILFLAVYFLLVAFLDIKFELLRDSCTSEKKPYSLSRVQLAWWMGFILCAFAAVIFNTSNSVLTLPTFGEGILIVLGISAGTTTVATITDVSEQKNNPLSRHQNEKSQGLFIDIISDKDGPSVHRLQTVLFNLIFAVWFFLKVYRSGEIPDLDSNTLVLLGLSSGTYAVIKTTENKVQNPAG